MKAFARAALAFLPILMLAPVPSQASEQATAAPTPISDLPSHGVIIFGELHGTREIPAFFSDQVETLLKSGHAVHVGLEMSASEQDGLLAAMTLPEAAQHRALLELDQWRDGEDGRNSVAMARMLRHLGQLDKRFQGRLSVFSYDIPSDWRGESNERDRFMADIIGRKRDRVPDDQYLLVLAGNAHAFGVPGAPWDPDFRSMTVQLKERYPVVSLRNLQSGGEAWICTPECGARTIQGLDRSRSRGIYLEPFAMDWSDRPVYDGVFFVGELSASEPLPAVAGPRKGPSLRD